jgi:hypothetical protein
MTWTLASVDCDGLGDLRSSSPDSGTEIERVVEKREIEPERLHSRQDRWAGEGIRRARHHISRGRFLRPSDVVFERPSRLHKRVSRKIAVVFVIRITKRIFVIGFILVIAWSFDR